MHRGRGVSISVNGMRVMIRPTHHRSLAGNHERGGTFVEPRASMGKKLSKKQQRNQVAAKHLEEQRAATAEGFKGADAAGGAHNPGQCTFPFRALQRGLPGLIVVPLPAAPRAPAGVWSGRARLWCTQKRRVGARRARGGGLGRPRWWWGRCSEVMRSAQGGRKMLLFSTSSLRLGVWWVIPGGLVRKIARPNL